MNIYDLSVTLPDAPVYPGDPVLHREQFADGLFMAVKGTLSAQEAARAREAGIELLPVAADDLCIYLTLKRKGGIDDALRTE